MTPKNSFVDAQWTLRKCRKDKLPQNKSGKLTQICWPVH